MEKNRKKYIYIYLNHFAIQQKFIQHVNQQCFDCLVPKLYLTLCNRKDCSLSVSSIHGISQVRILSGLPFLSPGDLSDPGIKPSSPAWQADSFPLSHLESPILQ